MTKTALEALEAIVSAPDFVTRVRALRAEAAGAGDLAQVQSCDRALEDLDAGNPSCLDCAVVLQAAEAQP